MKPVHLFWTPKNCNLSFLQMGWLHLRYHLFSWVLSAHSIRKFYPQLELITDDFGAEILVNELQLPYTHVRKDYQGLDLGYPDRIWATKKMYGYTLHDEPFINFDEDVFLWEALPKAMFEAPLCAQNIEVEVPFYWSALRDVQLHFKHQPAILKKILAHKSPLIASNAGILGANHLEFIQQYVQFGFDFLNQNLNKLSKVNQGNQNIIIEQLFFYELAREQGIPIAHLIEEPTTSRQFPHLTHFTALPGRCTYIHIMGGKKYPTTCEQLEQRVRIEYPDAYYRVLNLIRKHDLETNTFFFSPAEEKQALREADQKTEAPQNLKKWEDCFVRTIDVLKELKLHTHIKTVGSAQQFDETVQQLIATESKLCDRAKRVLGEVLTFENDLRIWMQNLPPVSYVEAHKRQNAQILDQILRLPPKERNQYKVHLNPHAFVWDCEWNWAEKQEFKQQVENTTPYRHNLKQDPAYFRVLAFIYPQQNTMREYLADPMSILILDALEEGQAMSIGTVLDKAFSMAKQLQANIEHAYREALLDKLTFLTYQWILIVENDKTSEII
ncbi:DUF6734 family protein [Haliscomenobacter sp.]|uniref:DUF6734 family protein n=1 Tax=Haliscomenobacter sp. TaxID=2717303 RepID=UPI0033650F4A